MNLTNLCRVAVCLLFLVTLLFSPAASASEISGVVKLSGKSLEGIVVSIEGAQVDGQPQSAVYTLDHKNLDLTPHVLVVRVGSTVRFENTDGMPCRIYSISSTGIFVLRGTDGKPATVTFDRPGVVEVRCADHARIYAYIVVKENSYFALADAAGRYQISNVPSGEYTLQVWYEGTVLKRKTVRVGAKNLNVDFKAALPRRNGRHEQAIAPASLPSGDEVAAAHDFLVTTQER